MFCLQFMYKHASAVYILHICSQSYRGCFAYLSEMGELIFFGGGK